MSQPPGLVQQKKRAIGAVRATEEACASVCQHATPLDPEARFIVYTGNNKRARISPNTSVKRHKQPSRVSRMVYGYYSYAGQLLDDELATYWTLPAAFGAATCGDPALFPDNFAYLQSRFPWLKIGEVLADAGACEQTCLDAIWQAGALRMVDICAHKSDDDPNTRLARGYDERDIPSVLWLRPAPQRLRLSTTTGKMALCQALPAGSRKTRAPLRLLEDQAQAWLHHDGRSHPC